jgi:hypothetical protein
MKYGPKPVVTVQIHSERTSKKLEAPFVLHLIMDLFEHYTVTIEAM